MKDPTTRPVEVQVIVNGFLISQLFDEVIARNRSGSVGGLLIGTYSTAANQNGQNDQTAENPNRNYREDQDQGGQQSIHQGDPSNSTSIGNYNLTGFLPLNLYSQGDSPSPNSLLTLRKVKSSQSNQSQPTHDQDNGSDSDPQQNYSYSLNLPLYLLLSRRISLLSSSSSASGGEEKVLGIYMGRQGLPHTLSQGDWRILKELGDLKLPSSSSSVPSSFPNSSSSVPSSNFSSSVKSQPIEASSLSLSSSSGGGGGIPLPPLINLNFDEKENGQGEGIGGKVIPTTLPSSFSPPPLFGLFTLNYDRSSTGEVDQEEEDDGWSSLLIQDFGFYLGNDGRRDAGRGSEKVVIRNLGGGGGVPAYASILSPSSLDKEEMDFWVDEILGKVVNRVFTKIQDANDSFLKNCYKL